MERISTKEFFTVMWRGVCQALGCFFGMFGYKRDGKYAKIIWGLFATSSAVIVTVFAVALLCMASHELSSRYRGHSDCVNPYCYDNTCVNRDIYFHYRTKGKGFVYNIRTGKKLLKNVEWIALPSGKDSLVCFSNGKKRGYFSKNTGKVVVAPQYDHAWVFSEGVASVEKDGYISLIDETGKVIIDKKWTYRQGGDGIVFHGGYCVVASEDGELYGMMDKTGKMVLPVEYNSIEGFNNYKMWCLHKGNERAVLDKTLKPIVPFMECTVYVGSGTIDLTMADHTMRKYDFEGNLINDFYIANVRVLEYEKDEIVYRNGEVGGADNDGDVYDYTEMHYYHPKATARMRAYVAGDGYEGLMTADGHVVTMPLYMDIEAIGYDLYLCTSTNSDKVIVNGKGELVR